MTRKKFDTPKVNKIEELSAQLLVMNEKLKRAEWERTQMIENISHDLRAPVTAIRSSIDYLRQAGSNNTLTREDIDQILELLDGRVRNLEVLIKDFYYLTSLDNANNHFVFEEVPIGGFLEDYFFTASVDDQYVNRNLKLEVPEHFPYTVRMDVAKMTRVLDNLFTNARKYSNDGDDIILGAYLDEDQSHVTFYVEDTGIGIPKDKIGMIFNRSFKVSDVRTPIGATGSGLGLAIVKGIIDKHNAIIECSSTYGRGSCFRITFILL